MALRACVSCSLKLQMSAGLAFLSLAWLVASSQPTGGEAKVVYPTSRVKCLPQMGSFQDTHSKLNLL